MREFERRVVLSVLDRRWREHLHEMDHLRHGIGLRAMAQKDPLVEYQREGFDLFNGMMDGIKEETVGYLFNAEVQVSEVDPDTAEAVAELTDASGGVADLLAAAVASGDVESARPEVSAKVWRPPGPVRWSTRPLPLMTAAECPRSWRTTEQRCRSTRTPRGPSGAGPNVRIASAVAERLPDLRRRHQPRAAAAS